MRAILASDGPQLKEVRGHPARPISPRVFRLRREPVSIGAGETCSRTLPTASRTTGRRTSAARGLRGLARRSWGRLCRTTTHCAHGGWDSGAGRRAAESGHREGGRRETGARGLGPLHGGRCGRAGRGQAAAHHEAEGGGSRGPGGETRVDGRAPGRPVQRRGAAVDDGDRRDGDGRQHGGSPGRRALGSGGRHLGGQCQQHAPQVTGDRGAGRRAEGGQHPPLLVHRGAAGLATHHVAVPPEQRGIVHRPVGVGGQLVAEAPAASAEGDTRDAGPHGAAHRDPGTARPSTGIRRLATGARSTSRAGRASLGSRCARASRSWARPRWMRERTVPSFTPSVAAISS